MRKTLLIAIGILFLLNVQAQSDANRKSNRDQIKAAKVAFITNKLSLDSETAQVFWPIFNDYEKEKSDLARKYYEEKRQYAINRDYSNMSEEEAGKMLELYVTQKETEAKIEKDYLPKFRKVLSAQQTWQLITSEAEFRRTLMEQISRGRNGESGKTPPNKKDN